MGHVDVLAKVTHLCTATDAVQLGLKAFVAPGGSPVHLTYICGSFNTVCLALQMKHNEELQQLKQQQDALRALLHQAEQQVVRL